MSISLNIQYYRNKYPNLENFFIGIGAEADVKGICFITDLIKEEARNYPSVNLALVLKEIKELVNEDLAQDEVKKVMIDLGLNINIENNDWQPTSHTYKDWIIDLKNLLQQEYTRSNTPS